MEITLTGPVEALAFAAVTQAPFWLFIYIRTIYKAWSVSARRNAHLYMKARAQGMDAAAVEARKNLTVAKHSPTEGDHIRKVAA